MTQTVRTGSVWHLPLLVAAFILGFALAATGQETGQPAIPDRSETARLVWTTLIAVDQANQTGNYSVLRDLGAPSFRQANDPAQLAAIFASIRDQDLGLSRVVLAVPVYAEPPKLLDNGLFQVKGSFPARPVGVGFELLFQHAEGAWRLFGIGIAPLDPAAAPDAGGASSQTAAE